MKLENEQELYTTLKWIERMKRQLDSAREEPSWNPELREMVADDIAAMIRNLEGQVSEYVREHREHAA